MRSLVAVLVLLIVPRVAAEAQSVARMRTAVLYEGRPLESTRLAIVADSGKRNDKQAGAIFGALLFGVLAAGAVSDADGGSLSKNLPIVLGSAAVGGLLGYLIGSAMSSD